jgi:hypothetical protein
MPMVVINLETPVGTATDGALAALETNESIALVGGDPVRRAPDRGARVIGTEDALA